MTVALLVLTAVITGFALVAVFTDPWVDWRNVDWDAFTDGLSTFYQERTW